MKMKRRKWGRKEMVKKKKKKRKGRKTLGKKGGGDGGGKTELKETGKKITNTNEGGAGPPKKMERTAPLFPAAPPTSPISAGRRRQSAHVQAQR